MTTNAIIIAPDSMLVERMNRMLFRNGYSVHNGCYLLVTHGWLYCASDDSRWHQRLPATFDVISRFPVGTNFMLAAPR